MAEPGGRQDRKLFERGWNLLVNFVHARIALVGWELCSALLAAAEQDSEELVQMGKEPAAGRLPLVNMTLLARTNGFDSRKKRYR